MSIHRFKYLFQQFVNKTASTEEIEEFLSVMKRDDYNEELQVLLDEFWKEPASITPMGFEKAEKLFNRIMASSQGDETVQPRIYGKRLWVRWVAAALIIIGFSALFYQWDFEPSDLKPVPVVKNDKPFDANKPVRRFINLPDGSSVILNENSMLEISKQFILNGKREVYLEGEAYFDIALDVSHPFIVHTGKLQTTVLGTAFNINATRGNRIVTVTVTKGKVKIGDNKQTFNVIDPNEQVIFDQELSRHIKKPVIAKDVVAWKNADIYFDDVNIKDVANQLEERFGVTINFSNEAIGNCRFSATFLKSQSLEQILNVIGKFNHIGYQFKDEHTILLDGTGCE